MFTNAVADQMNEIFFRRGQQILDIDLREGTCDAALLATGLRNLECLGYMFRKEDIERLRNSDEDSVATCLARATRVIKTVLTNDPEYDGKLQYSPMYPGFPRQVMTASAAELFINAILHYLSDGKYMPDSTMTEHARRKEGVFMPKSLKQLKLGTLDEFKEMFRLLMNAATSISATDEDDLRFFFHNFEDAQDFIPAKPVFKENSAILANLCVTESGISLEQYADRHADEFCNPTDVLRLAAVLSGCDASLAENPRFGHFSRSDRKAMLRLLEGCTCLLENMARRRETWLRLGEALHPGDYPRFEKVNAAYMKLRGGDIPMTFAGQFNTACMDGDFATAVRLMGQRPGEFARTIDLMLRRAADTAPILDAFEAVADKVATRVLLQLREHFLHRHCENLQPLDMSLSPEERQAKRAEEQAEIKQAVAEALHKQEEYLQRVQKELDNLLERQAQETTRDDKAKMEAAIAEAKEMLANQLASLKEQLETECCKLEEKRADYENEEERCQILSRNAVLESTFDKRRINAELAEKAEAGDDFARSLISLAEYLTTNVGIVCTDDGGASSLKFNGGYRLSDRGRSMYASIKQLEGVITSIEQRIQDTECKLKNVEYDIQRQCSSALYYLISNIQQKRNGLESGRRWLKEIPKAVAEATKKRIAEREITDGSPIRVFFPKGEMAKSHVILDKLPGIPCESSRRMVEICENALVRQYARRECLGKVWVSEQFSQYLVPFSQRSASKALRTVVRGSRIPWAPETKIVRGFIWWKNSEYGRTDIDLSAMMMDENWKYVEHVSFTNLRSAQTGSCHSGDIVDAPKGAAEYIDIDLKKAKAAGVRYVAFNVYGFTRQPFCDLPECSFGWMERDKAEGGQIFEAASVRNKIDLSCRSKIALPVIFDLEEGVAIWMDMALKERFSCIALENNAKGVIAVCRALVEMHKPNLYDLVQLHIRARGEQVDEKAQADVIFDVDDGITPYDVEKWMAEYI
ncbi:MAG: hypothetical protein J6X49_06425 [Victivallales bacterium]|nr:hypothetical protein [Victivallales bacterium]